MMTSSACHRASVPRHLRHKTETRLLANGVDMRIHKPQDANLYNRRVLMFPSCEIKRVLSDVGMSHAYRYIYTENRVGVI